MAEPGSKSNDRVEKGLRANHVINPVYIQESWYIIINSPAYFSKVDKIMRTKLMALTILLSALALSSCSDTDYTGMCLNSALKKIPKGAETSITKENVIKQGLSATVTLAITAITKQKKGGEKFSYFNASCIIKGDRVATSIVRPASG